MAYKKREPKFPFFISCVDGWVYLPQHFLYFLPLPQRARLVTSDFGRFAAVRVLAVDIAVHVVPAAVFTAEESVLTQGLGHTVDRIACFKGYFTGLVGFGAVLGGGNFKVPSPPRLPTISSCLHDRPRHGCSDAPFR